MATSARCSRTTGICTRCSTRIATGTRTAFKPRTIPAHRTASSWGSAAPSNSAWASIASTTACATGYLVIDEERGLILAGGFIDHSGRTTEYRLTDGRQVKANIAHPNSLSYLETF